LYDSLSRSAAGRLTMSVRCRRARPGRMLKKRLPMWRGLVSPAWCRSKETAVEGADDVAVASFSTLVVPGRRPGIR